MRFARIERKHQNIDKPLQYGWMLCIGSLKELINYQERYEKRQAELAFTDSLKCSATVREDGSVSLSHFTNALAMCTNVRAEAMETSFVVALGGLLSDKFFAMGRALPVYVNRNGGWFSADEHCTVFEEVDLDHWPRETDEKPRFLQWPNGTHWYVKIGPDDVEVDGKMKWDTQAEAESAYNRWKREHR